MRTVYVDSGAFIAVMRRRDSNHAAFSKHFAKLRADRDRLITSDAVVSETATRLRYDIGLDAALSFKRVLAEAGASLSIRESEPRLRDAAFQVMSRFADLRLSYPDCFGAVIAKQAGATVFSLDNDFRILGLTVEP